MRNVLVLGIVGFLLAGWGMVDAAEPMPAAKLNVDAAKLPNTLVTPVLDAPIPDGVNVIWCASFQLAWNELPAVTISDSMFASLNQPVVTKADVNNADVVACAGTDGQALKRKVRRELAAKFGEATATPLLEQWQPSPGVSFYAYMRMSMPFEYAFKQMDPFAFGEPQGEEAGSDQKAIPHFAAFGLAQYKSDNPGMQKMGRQVLIIWHEFGKDEETPQRFVIELKTRSPDYRLLLAKLPAETSLDRAVATVMGKAAHPNQLTFAAYEAELKTMLSDANTKPADEAWEAFFARSSKLSELCDREWVQVPVLDFDLSKRYGELVGQKTSADPIADAMQRIRFKLDRTGAALESESAGSLFAREPRMFVCEPPYLVLIVSAKTSKPILACWIANAELLTPEQPAAEEEPAQRLFPDPAP